MLVFCVQVINPLEKVCLNFPHIIGIVQTSQCKLLRPASRRVQLHFSVLTPSQVEGFGRALQLQVKAMSGNASLVIVVAAFAYYTLWCLATVRL